jgi:hypothetical protein
MFLVQEGDGWRVVGQGSERARVAYASEKNGQLVFTLEPMPAASALRRTV